jgi:hypothetical protein
MELEWERVLDVGITPVLYSTLCAVCASFLIDIQVGVCCWIFPCGLGRHAYSHIFPVEE